MRCPAVACQLNVLKAENYLVTGDTFDRVREMESLHFWKGR